MVILLQPGKADAGALFSSTLSSTAFGPRGTASLLAKITIGAAVAFMLIALTLGLPTADWLAFGVAIGECAGGDTDSGAGANEASPAAPAASPAASQ